MIKGRMPSEDGGEENVSDSPQCTCSSGNNDYFCKQCRSVICKFCISTKHKRHVCKLVGEAARDVRNDIREYDPGQKKKEKMDSFLRPQQMITSMKTDLIALETKATDKIDERLNDLRNELKKIHSKLLQKVHEIVWKNSEHLNKAQRVLNNTEFFPRTPDKDGFQAMFGKISMQSESRERKTDGSDIKKLAISAQKGTEDVHKESSDETTASQLPTTLVPAACSSGGAASRISMQSESRERKTDGSPIQKLAISAQKGTEDVQKESSDETTASQLPTTLVPGACSSGGAASRMAGITKRSSFCVNFDLLYVTCVTDDMCWCGWLYSTDIRLVDMTGRVVRSRTLPDNCRGLTSRDGTVYLSCYNKTVYKLSTDDTLTVVQQCLTFYPGGLTCLPVTGELLVCGGWAGVFSVTEWGVQPALTGIKFGNASDIAVNDDGDVCVSDEGQREVFIFSSDRRHVATYTGHADMTRTMRPQGVTCDGRGGFIVCDSNNHMLHVISRDGDNVMVYNTGTDGDTGPLGLDMTQSGRLWVCFYGGHICVYKKT